MPPVRLLDTSTYQLVAWEKRTSPTASYAILSHRWRDEITFDDFRSRPNASLSSLKLDPRFESSRRKLLGACRLASDAGIPYIWADTTCIDKSSSEELSRSLGSMFDWYRESAKCYAFLDDVKAGNDAKAFARVPREGVSTVETLPGEGSGPKYSVWFVRRLLKTQTEQTTDLTQTRGWTLQELLAPKVMDFFDQHWKLIGSRSRRAPQIRQITGIDEQFLEGKDRLEDASMATKMSWMAGRTTGFVEDIAYSLIGLFGISMQPMYGEGIKAFTRLQEALLTDPSFDESLLAWQSGVVLRCFGEEAEWKVDEWGFLAPSPDCFTLSRDLAKAENPVRLGGGFRPSGQGINVSLPVMELRTFFRGDLKEITFPLNCTRDGKTIVLRLMRPSTKSLAWRRTDCSAPLREKAKAKVGDNRHWGVNLPLGRQITVESSYYSL